MAFVSVSKTGSGAAVGTTLTAPHTDGSFDVVIAAAAGDVLEVGAGIIWGATNANYTYGDVAVMVGGSPVRYLSSGGSSPASLNVPSWWCTRLADFPVMRGSHFYTVQSGDVVSGQVTLRFYARIVSGAPRSLDSGTPNRLWARTVTPPPVSAAAVTTAYGTAWTKLAQVSVAAAAGDVVEIRPQMVMDFGDASAKPVAYHDVAVMVGGSPVFWESTGASSQSDTGRPQWVCPLLDYDRVTGTTLHTVTSGEVESGQVTFAFYGRTAGANRKLFSGAALVARKVA